MFMHRQAVFTFTLEIEGVPVAAYAVEDEAKAWLAAPPDEDLMLLQLNGKPLWDAKAPRSVRPALPEEVVRFWRGCPASENPLYWIVYFGPVVDPWAGCAKDVITDEDEIEAMEIAIAEGRFIFPEIL